MGEAQFSFYAKFMTHFMGTISFLSNTGLLVGPLIHIKKTYRMIYSLRLVNVYFGNIFEGFLNSLDQSFKSRDSSMTRYDDIYCIKTRGKLTEVGVSVVANNYMGVLFLAYILSRIFSIFERLFKTKIRSIRNIDSVWPKVVVIFDRIKFSLFISLIYDLSFYSMHELLHHDLNIEQSSMSQLSYSTSLIVFSLTVLDLTLVTYKLKNQRIEKFKKAAKLKKNIKLIFNADFGRVMDKEEANRVEKIFFKEWDYHYGKEHCFFVRGLDYNKLDNFFVRAVSLFSVYKTLILFMIILSLQSTPLAQILLLSFIQFLYHFLLLSL